MKQGRLLKPLVSKLAGSEKRTTHRAGTRCAMQRHSSYPGVWVLWFGKQYALVNSVDLQETVEEYGQHQGK